MAIKCITGYRVLWYEFPDWEITHFRAILMKCLTCVCGLRLSDTFVPRETRYFCHGSPPFRKEIIYFVCLTRCVIYCSISSWRIHTCADRLAVSTVCQVSVHEREKKMWPLHWILWNFFNNVNPVIVANLRLWRIMSWIGELFKQHMWARIKATSLTYKFVISDGVVWSRGSPTF